MAEGDFRIGVMGMGVVGNAVARYFEEAGADLRTYDNFKSYNTLEELNTADVIFICVPTPYHPEWGLDYRAAEECISLLEPGKQVLIKSTLQPGTTEMLQQQYPKQEIFFQPEFLREKTAVEDFLNPDRQIIGYCGDREEAARELLKLLPAAPYEEAMPATSAELVKIATNSFLALKVAFANQLFDVSQALLADFDAVLSGISADPRIGGSHLNVLDGGYRGYGGKCLPKDIQGLVDTARSVGHPFTILEAAHAYNDELIMAPVP